MKKGDASNPAAIVARGTALGYTNIRATREGGVEWGEPLITNDAWERRVKRNLDAVVSYLRAEEKAHKTETAREPTESEKRIRTGEDLRRLRALWRDTAIVLDRLEWKS